METPPRTVELTDELRTKLTSVSTATLASQMQRRGYWNNFLGGLQPLHDGQSMVGYAHTIRYVPQRPDVGEIMGFNAQKEAAESVEPDEMERLIRRIRSLSSRARCCLSRSAIIMACTLSRSSRKRFSINSRSLALTFPNSAK